MLRSRYGCRRSQIFFAINSERLDRYACFKMAISCFLPIIKSFILGHNFKKNPRECQIACFLPTFGTLTDFCPYFGFYLCPLMNHLVSNIDRTVRLFGGTGGIDTGIGNGGRGYVVGAVDDTHGIVDHADA